MGAALAVLAGFGLGACDCGGGEQPGGDGGMACPEMCGSGEACCPAMAMCVPVDLDALCEGTERCAGMDAVQFDDACQPSCTQCERPEPLQPGLLATYLDVAVQPGTGELWLSGYAPGYPGRRYGDLVVGRWEPATSSVQWAVVDGVPEDASPEADPEGWRGGVTAPGDDVGRWSSLAFADDGTLYVAYYDKTNGALKVAVRSGDAWSVMSVDAEGDAGRYASLVVTSQIPTVAYLVLLPPAEGSARPRSVVRVARAMRPRPAAASDWQRTDVVTSEIPCRPWLCPDGQVCLQSGECAVPTSDCAMPCADDEACVGGSCQKALPDGYVEDVPSAVGLYLSLAETPSGGLALVYYDRVGGNLYGVSYEGGSWSEPFLIDGWARGERGVGDSGWAASLFVASDGAWHVAYVDGAEEALRYARIQDAASGSPRIERALVDDGSTRDGTTRWSDGRHLVGDDASIVVTTSGEVRIAYQDATLQQARLARSSDGSTFRLSVLDDQGATGFWVEQVLTGPERSAVALWWRSLAGTETPEPNGVRLLTVE